MQHPRVFVPAVLLILAHAAAAQPVICPDADGDGLVLDPDLGAVLADYCLTGALAGDTFVDGGVNLFDVAPILACFGNGYPPGTRGCGPTMCTPPLVGQFRVAVVGTETCAGTPVTTLGGFPIFQHPAGNDQPPNPANICLDPLLAFDSYLAPGGEAITCSTPPAPTMFTFTSPAFTTSALDCDWSPSTDFAPPVAFMESRSAPVPLLGEESVFIARLTLARGSRLLNTPLRAFIQDETGWHRITADINGPGVAVSDDAQPLARPYGVRTDLAARVSLAPDPFGLADVYDLYLVSNPIDTSPQICPDVIRDGFVNVMDVLSVLADYCSVSPTGGDTFVDGVVNLFDLVPVLGCYGNIYPPGSGGCGVTVCEPPLTAEFRLGTIGTDHCLASFPLGTTTNGPIFQHPAGTNTPPTPDDVCGEPFLAFDSYVAVGDEPIGCASAAAPPVVFAGDSIGFTANSLSADWFREFSAGPAPFTDSRIAPIPFGSESIFIARITVRRGERLRRCPMRAYVQDSLGWHRLTMLLDGRTTVISDDGVPMAHSYAVRSHRAAQPDLTPLGFGLADVYDLYLVSDAASGDEDVNGCVAFNDVTTVLANWAADYRPCSGAGDADGNGRVQFADVTFVLAQWAPPHVCP